jgi:RNA polymerase sigma factor (sigma-70 family)
VIDYSTIGTPEQRSLVRRIVGGVIRKVPPWVLPDDVRQAAFMGLWDALRRNPDTGGAGYEWYLRMRIRGSILDELRAQDWLPRRHRGDAPTTGMSVHRFDEISPQFLEQLADAGKSPEALVIERRETAEALRAPLSSKERTIVELVFLAARTQKFEDVATLLGCSEPRVSQLYHRALVTMRAQLTGETTLPVKFEWGMPRDARKTIEETHANRKHRRPHRTARDPQGGYSSERSDARPIRASRLGAAVPASHHRPGPGQGGRALVGASPRAVDPCRARVAGRARAATARALPDRSVAPMSPAVVSPKAAPAPSTLPESGIDLFREVARYRSWLVEQALLRTLGNRAQAAKLLGLNRTTLVEMLKREARAEDAGSAVGAPATDAGELRARMDELIAEAYERTGNASEAARILGIARTTLTRRTSSAPPRPSQSEAESESETEPTLPPPPRTPRDIGSEPPSSVRALDGVERISRATIAALKAEGLTTSEIARRLCVNRFLIEKGLRTPAPLAKCRK